MRPRIRSVKPEIFHDEKLWELGETTGMPVYQGFQGLWCHADREGRFEWRPRALKSLILPYWSGNFSEMLDAFERFGFVIKYEVAGRVYGWIRKFKDHQNINAREPASTIPEPPAQAPHVHAYAPHVHASGEGKGRELEGSWKGAGREGASTDAECATTPPSVPGLDRVAGPEPDGASQATWNKLGSDYEPPDELVQEAVMANISAEYFVQRVHEARNSPIGGRKGVFSREDWIRKQFRFWVVDERTEKARAEQALQQPRAGPKRHGSAQQDHGIDPFRSLKGPDP